MGKRDEAYRRMFGGLIGLALVTAAIGVPACAARVAYVARHPGEVSSWWKVL